VLGLENLWWPCCDIILSRDGCHSVSHTTSSSYMALTFFPLISGGLCLLCLNIGCLRAALTNSWNLAWLKLSYRNVMYFHLILLGCLVLETSQHALRKLAGILAGCLNWGPNWQLTSTQWVGELPDASSPQAQIHPLLAFLPPQMAICGT
jgi:hypothetical protein